MVKFIAALAVFVAAVAVTLCFGSIEVYNYSPENMNLEIWVEPAQVSLAEGTFAVCCRINNIAGEPVAFDGFFDTVGPHLGWCSFTDHQPRIEIEKPDGSEFDLPIYTRIETPRNSKVVGSLPPEGISGRGTYSAKTLNLGPGEYTATFTLMGITRETTFTILD